MACRIGIVPDLHARLLNPSSRKDNYYEAMINKLEFILQNCGVVVQLGDFFDKPRTEDVVKNRVLGLFNQYKKPIYIVPGNHDIEKDQIDTLSSTSLGNLAYHNAVTILTPDRIWTIGGIKFGVLDYYIEKAKAQSFDERIDVLVGHHFFEWGRDPKVSIETTDLYKYNAKYLFLGHDHQPWEDKIFMFDKDNQAYQTCPETLAKFDKDEKPNTTTVIRRGSVMRKDLAAYSESHQPQFTVISTDNGKILDIEHIDIPCTPFKYAFFYEEKKTFKKCAKLVSDIKSFLEGMDLQAKRKESMRTILNDQLKAPKEVVEYLDLIHRVNHLQF